MFQLAGHQTFKVSELNIRCIRYSDSGERIYKLVQPNPRGKRELEFYKRVSNLDENGNPKISAPSNEKENQRSKSKPKSKDLDALKIGSDLYQNFLPQFFGTCKFETHDYLILQNLNSFAPETATFADVKIGRLTHDPEADAAKIAKQHNNWPDMVKVGYRFLGLRRPNSQVKKADFKKLTFESRLWALEQFLGPEEDNTTSDPDLQKSNTVARKFVSELTHLKNWFLTQKSFQFYSSSLYLSYCSHSEQISVKMIDFAHVFYEEKIDLNYLFGLSRLINDLNEHFVNK